MAMVGGNSWPTLLDVTRRVAPDSNIADIAEMLDASNPILKDMPFEECNDGSTHVSTIRTGLPDATWRLLNYGVPASKSQTAQVRDVTGMLEAFSQVDAALVDKHVDAQKFRLSEEHPFIESMDQTMASTLFYGNVARTPEKFHGLSPRFNLASTTETNIGYNIIKAGGASTDNTSIWLINWGPKSAFGLYPFGSKAGLQQTDLGKVLARDAAGNEFLAYKSHFKWDIGFCVKDWRYLSRIANIDVSDLLTAGTTSDTSAVLELLMSDAIEKLQSAEGRPVFYCNRSVMTALKRRLLTNSRTYLNWEDWGESKKVMTFMGIPVRRTDALTNAESVVA